MTNIGDKILEHLLPFGENEETDILDFVRTGLGLDQNSIDGTNKLFKALDILVERKFITYICNKYFSERGEFLHTHHPQVPLSDKLQLFATLKPLGRDHIEQKLRQQQQDLSFQKLSKAIISVGKFDRIKQALTIFGFEDELLIKYAD